MTSYARPVYSTESGSLCSQCGQKPCTCHSKNPSQVKGPVRVSRQTKGRKGAGVTVISGLDLPEIELKILLSRWKKRLGSGGTYRDGVLEIQGDHRDLLVAELAALGITAKKSGS